MIHLFKSGQVSPVTAVFIEVSPLFEDIPSSKLVYKGKKFPPTTSAECRFKLIYRL